MNTSQKLGIKVFYYYLSKKISAGIALLVVSFIISSFKDSMVSGLNSFLSLITATSIVTYFINGLFIVSVLLLVLGGLMSWFKYISCDFTLGENAFSIRKGVLSKKEVSIPYRQIQNIDIEQSFNFKMMGVCKLVILTAGNDNNDKDGESEGVFDVIDFKVASSIKEMILQKTNIQPAV